MTSASRLVREPPRGATSRRVLSGSTRIAKCTRLLGTSAATRSRNASSTSTCGRTGRRSTSSSTRRRLCRSSCRQRSGPSTASSSTTCSASTKTCAFADVVTAKLTNPSSKLVKVSKEKKGDREVRLAEGLGMSSSPEEVRIYLVA